MTKISIVIPCLNGSKFIDDLLDSIDKQTFKPFEIIIIDSGSNDSDQTLLKIKNSSLSNYIKYKSIGLAYPGRSRNMGVKMSKGDWIAFLDLRTLPSPDWLQKLYKYSQNGKYNFIVSLRNCEVSSYYQKILRAATYGNIPAKSLAGSLINRNFFNSTRGFLEFVRAGEDLEWMNRAFFICNTNVLIDSLILYKGMPHDLFSTLKKWYIYSYENSKIDILRAQKFLYFLIALVLFFYSIFSYNFVFTSDLWEESNFFIPHLNKTLWSVILIFYFIYRGAIKPILLKELKSFIFPINWIFIGSVGILIDIVKTPGRLLGFVSSMLIKNKSIKIPKE